MRAWLTHRIGKILKERRKELGISLSSLAWQSGMRTSSLVRIEQGVVDIDLCLLETIATFLNYDVGTLVRQAYASDDEQLLLVGLPQLKAPLARMHRQVHTARTSRDAVRFAEQWRLDLVVFGTDPKAEVVAEITRKHTHALCLSAATGNLLGSTHFAVGSHYDVASRESLLAAIDDILLATTKGAICPLRRGKEELQDTKQALEATRQRIHAQEHARFSERKYGWISNRLKDALDAEIS